MKIHCHLCGATLRRPDQYRSLSRPDEQDVVHVCVDEDRCERRAAFDPVTGKPHERSAGAASHAVFPNRSS